MTETSTGPEPGSTAEPGRRAEELRDPIKKMLEVKFGKVSYGKCWYKTSRKSRAVLQRPALYIG